MAGATYRQALCALLLFLYKKMLQVDLGWIEGISRPNRAPKRPTVLNGQYPPRVCCSALSDGYSPTAVW